MQESHCDRVGSGLQASAMNRLWRYLRNAMVPLHVRITLLFTGIVVITLFWSVLGVYQGVMQDLVVEAQREQISGYLLGQLLWGATGILVAIICVGVYLRRYIYRLLAGLERTVSAIATGEFSRRLAVTDYESIKYLASAINDMASELERLSNVRSDFFSKVSHELRTPLTIIQGYALTLLRQSDLAPADTQALDVIAREASLLDRLVADLLDIARSDSGELHLQMAWCDLAELPHTMEIAYREQAEAAQISLECSQLGAPVWAFIDPHRLYQVFGNLLDNALAHTQPGGRIQMLLSLQGDRIVLTVSDNGHGIAVEHLPFIFDRFYRVSSNKRGAGLGLTIAKELVIAHGGNICVQSTPGVGTCFTIELPNIAPPDEYLGVT